MNPFGHQEDDDGRRRTDMFPVPSPVAACEHTPGLSVETTLEGKIEFGHETDIVQQGAQHLFDLVRVHVCPRVVVVVAHAAPHFDRRAGFRTEFQPMQITEGCP